MAKVKNFKEYSDLLGMGSSREVYPHGDGEVKKKAYTAGGILQNKTEVEISKDPEVNSIVAKVLDFDPSFKWIVSERLTPISEDDIRKHIKYFYFIELYFSYLNFDEELSGGSRIPHDYFNDVFFNAKDFTSRLTHKKIFSHLDNDVFIQELFKLYKKYNLVLNDLMNRKNYGLDKNGNVKLLDYGLKKEHK